MNKKYIIAGGVVGLSAFGVFVFNGDCVGFDHQILVTEQLNWCINDDQYKEAKDFLEKRIKGSTSYYSDAVIALVSYDSDFRKKIKDLLEDKRSQYNEIDEDDIVLVDYLSRGIIPKPTNYGGDEIQIDTVNDLFEHN